MSTRRSCLSGVQEMVDEQWKESKFGLSRLTDSWIAVMTCNLANVVMFRGKVKDSA
jgi:hypothetical protein